MADRLSPGISAPHGPISLATSKTHRIKERGCPKLFCGIDWAEHHHDVALVDRSCRVEAQLRIGDDAAGYRQLVDVLADHGDTPEEPIPVAIETGRNLLVACLHATGRAV